MKEAIPDVACGASTYIVDYYNSHGGQMPTGEAWVQFWFDYALEQIGPFGAIVAAGLQEQMATDLANKVSATETPQEAQQLCSLAEQL